MFWLFGNKKKDKEEQLKLKRTITANEFVNVRDIRDNIVYTKDNHLFMYLKIQPISLELLSPKERKIKGKQFSAEFSAIKGSYKIFSISRPVDVSFMLQHLQELYLNSTNQKQKEMNMNKIREVNQLALSGEILENQFFCVLWVQNNKKDSDRELLKKSNEIIARFKVCEMNVSICNHSDIVKLLNLFGNPNYAHLEDNDIGEHMPFVI